MAGVQTGDGLLSDFKIARMLKPSRCQLPALHDDALSRNNIADSELVFLLCALIDRDRELLLFGVHVAQEHDDVSQVGLFALVEGPCHADVRLHSHDDAAEVQPFSAHASGILRLR